MRSAIRMVREELGADAVILSNDRVNGGVEIVAAVDYDETILDQPATSRRNSIPKEKPLSGEKNKPEKKPAVSCSEAPAKTATAAAQRPRPEIPQERAKQTSVAREPSALNKEPSAPNKEPSTLNKKPSAPNKESSTAVRREPYVRFDDFNGIVDDEQDDFLNPEVFNELVKTTSESFESSFNDIDQHTLPNTYLDHDGNEPGYDYNEEEFDADYSDDPYGNQHLSLSLQSKIDSAFNPAVRPGKESPYLRQNGERNIEKMIHSNVESPKPTTDSEKTPDNNELNTVAKTGIDTGVNTGIQTTSKTTKNTTANTAATNASLKNSTKPHNSFDEEFFDESFPGSHDVSGFFAVDEVSPDESEVDNTLIDITHTRDSKTVHNCHPDDKGSYSTWSQEPALMAMRQEITTLRGMLEQELNGLAWQDLKKNNPMRAKLIKQLLELGFSPELADQVIVAAKGQIEYSRAWQMTLSALAEKLPIKDDDVVLSGGIVALVGATGVGKTTTIAKLAARYALRHGRNSVVLITTDTYRIGALEQLRTYGRILGIPVKIAHNKKQLQDLLRLLGDKKFVLIDTAGMGQRDIRLMEQFSVINDCAKGLKTLLVLSSTTHRAALEETVRTFSNVEINSCILSKLDETTNLGGALSVVAEHQLPVAYISDGQRVPEDLHLARAHTLINRCVTIARQANQFLDNDSLELAYSRMPSHVSA